MSSPEHRAGASSSFAGMRAIASSRRVLWAAALAVMVLALALAAYLYDHSRRDLIASGVRIDGIDVGGMREAGARVKLERTLATDLRRPALSKRRLWARRAHCRRRTRR